jgi:hypothetical protein
LTTIAEWLRERAPAAPAELSTRVVEVLGARAEADASRAPSLCLDAASEVLQTLVAKPDAGREAALDLLSADALVTYAFEAGSTTPGWIAEQAPAAMARFAEVARLTAHHSTGGR